MCLVLPPGPVRPVGVRQAPKQPERPVPEAGVAGAGAAAEPPGPAAAEGVVRPRVPVASSESAEPMRALARLPANPCRRLMEPRPARLERLEARARWAGQEPPAALEAQPAPELRRQVSVAQAEAVLG